MGRVKHNFSRLTSRLRIKSLALRMRLRSGAILRRLRPERIVANYAESAAIHNAGSFLLGMPGEIKNLIYQFALGENDIHITMPVATKPSNPSHSSHRHHGKPHHITCVSAVSSQAAYDSFWSADPKTNPYTVSVFSHKHQQCYEITRTKRVRLISPRNPVMHRLSLNLLLTCRQIYTEASLFPLQGNTFTFHCAHILLSFLSSASLPVTQPRQPMLQHIRSLSLDIQIVHHDDEDIWAQPIEMVPTALPNLHALTVVVHEICCICWADTYHEGMEQRDMWRMLRRLGRECKELKNCRVMIEDQGYLSQALGKGWWDNERSWREEYGRGRWTLEEKRAWAKKVEGWILGRGPSCERSRAR